MIMSVKLSAADIRSIVKEMGECTEEPHHHLTSFRIRGKIFATMPSDFSFLNIFVSEECRERTLGMYPESFEKLWWGKNVVGLKANPEKADRKDIEMLLREACIYKVTKK